MIIDNKIITDHIINFLSGVVLGNAQQNKVLTLDRNKDITGINSLDLIQPLDNGSGGTGINTYNKGDILVASDNNILTKLNIPISNGEFLTTDTSTNVGISWNSYLLKNYLRFSDPEYLTSTTYFIEYLYTKLSNNLFIENKTLDLDTIGINGLLSSSTLSGTVLIDSISTTVTGTNTTFTTDFVVGDVINILNNYRRITNITSNTQLTIDSVYTLLNTWTLSGTASLSTTQKKFGLKALNTVNATSYASLNIGTYSGFSALSSAWTIELFFFLSATNANLVLTTSTTTFSFQLSYVRNSKQLSISLGQGTTFNIANASLITGTIAGSTWYHVAVTYTGSLYRIYFNGTLGLTINSATKISSTAFNSLIIGGNGTTAFNGFIDEVRVSDSVRYSSNFTPTTSQFTVDANTISLNHFENTTVNNSDDTLNVQFSYSRNGKYYSDSLLYLYGVSNDVNTGYILSNRSDVNQLVDVPSGYNTIIKLPFCIPVINNVPLNVYKNGNYVSYFPYYTIVTNATNITTTTYNLSNVIPNDCKMVNILVTHNHFGTTESSINIGSSNNIQNILRINITLNHSLTIKIPIHDSNQLIQAYLSNVASTTSYTLALCGIYY